MTSFRFNFSGVEDTPYEIEEKEEISWLESSQVFPDREKLKNVDNIVTHARMFTYGDVEIGHILAEKLQKKDNTVNGDSDLVPGKYEGGSKIWECTYDLIEYLTENQASISFANKTVLDLGCGAGILGIYAFLNESLVTFQDYNKEVIENVTIPNVLLNIEEEDREMDIDKCEFYCGDWGSFNEILPESKTFDVILTSETIYNIQNYTKLLNFFTQRLSDNGTAYVAAKTYYFGVGGGTRLFETEIEKTGMLKSEVIWRSSGGIQREILKINRIMESYTNFNYEIITIQ